MWQGDSVSNSCPFLLDNIEPWKVLAAIATFGSIPTISFVMRNRLWLFGIEEAISSTHSTGINIEWMSFLRSIIRQKDHQVDLVVFLCCLHYIVVISPLLSIHLGYCWRQKSLAMQMGK